MSQYFDKDFWRFLMGFIAIICTSIIILLASRLYQEEGRVGDDVDGAVGAVINFNQ